MFTNKNLNIYWRLSWCLVGLFMAGCGAVGPPPPPVDIYQVNVGQESISSGEVASGLYRVSGVPGSVPVTSTVSITNNRTSAQVIVLPNTDGSFSAQIKAERGDRLSVIIKDQFGVPSEPVFVYVGLLNIKNPYLDGGYWYVGQTHFHTRNTDGKNTAAQMETAYYDRGYDFLISTDHRGTVPSFTSPLHGNTPDPENFSGKNLLWISGSELGFGDGHMGAWGASPVPSAAYFGTQNKIDEVRQNRGLVALNHPHNKEAVYAWDWGTETRFIKGFSFVEAFNGKHATVEGVVAELNHIPTALDLADEFQQVWWIGTDDCHDKDDPLQFDRYAIVVQTDRDVIDREDILGFADAGRFYIRQTAGGPVLSSVKVEGNTATVTMQDVDSNYQISWKKRGNEIVKSELVNITSSYTVQGGEGYVRAEIQRVSDGLSAFTQPLFIANNNDLSVAVTGPAGTNVQYLIDNKRSTFWEAPLETASFVVDVGRVRQINAIKIDWRSADAETRRFNYRIETSATGAFNGEQTEAVRETYSNRQAQTLDFFDEYTRYVKVTVTSQSTGDIPVVQINEVEVFDSSPARTELYLDNVDGNDTNSGLKDSPWRTFLHAREWVRPRDTLNFIRKATPYNEDITLITRHSGKHPNATARYQGDPEVLTELNYAGTNNGIRFNGARFVDWMFFDIRSAAFANVLVSAGSSDISIMFNRLRDGRDRGFVGNGKFTLAYNLIYGNATDGAFIYWDNVEAKIYNNVIYGNGNYGLGFHNTYENVPPVAEVMNNIIAGNAGAALRRGDLGTITDGYNCVDGSYSGPWQKTSNIDSNPLFMSPQTGDFRLQAASPCIDAGIDVGLSADFAGNAPRDEPSVVNTGSAGNHDRNFIDIGAYEFAY